MNKVINWLKSIRPGKVIAVFLSSLLLFVSTACNNTPKVLANTGGPGNNTRQEVPSGLQDVGAGSGKDARPEVPSEVKSNPYEKNTMNEYSEVDPRTDTSRADAKAKALVDNAERNINTKGIDSTEQYVENYRSGTPLGERVRRIGEDVSNSAKEVTEGVSKGTQKGLENVKGNTQDAADKAPSAVKSKVSSDIKNTKRGLEKAADAID